MADDELLSLGYLWPGCPFRAENRGGPLPADADCCLIAEVVSKPGAGSRFTGRSVSLRARGLDFSSCALAPAGSGRPTVGGGQVLTRSQDSEELIERVAALDIGKGGADVLRAGPR